VRRELAGSSLTCWVKNRHGWDFRGNWNLALHLRVQGRWLVATSLCCCCCHHSGPPQSPQPSLPARWPYRWEPFCCSFTAVIIVGLWGGDIIAVWLLLWFTCSARMQITWPGFVFIFLDLLRNLLWLFVSVSQSPFSHFNSLNFPHHVHIYLYISIYISMSLSLSL